MGTVCSEAARHYLRLSLLRGIGPHTGQRIVKAAGGIDKVWQLSPEGWRNIEGVSERLVFALTSSDEVEVEKIAATCGKHGIGILCPDDECYPVYLKELDDAPLVLFTVGQHEVLKHSRMLSVVGARKAGKESRLLARRWCRALSDQGVCVVSGMAYGVDAAAHGGTLEGAGLTVAVIGSGLLAKFTPEQQRQIDAISRRGGVISEFLPNTEARPEHFPRRNRIIAGISKGTLVVEAAIKSGSLITARNAAEYGHEVLAVPGSVLNEAHGGCHQLIREGATLVESVSDILAQLGWASDVGKKAASTYVPATPGEAKILELLARETMHVDRLAEESGLTMPELSPILLALELLGAVQRLPGSRYMLGDAG